MLIQLYLEGSPYGDASTERYEGNELEGEDRKE